MGAGLTGITCPPPWLQHMPHDTRGPVSTELCARVYAIIQGTDVRCRGVRCPMIPVLQRPRPGWYARGGAAFVQVGDPLGLGPVGASSRDHDPGPPPHLLVR